MIRYFVRTLLLGFMITPATSSAGVAQEVAAWPGGVDASLLQEGIDSLAIYLIRNGDTIRTGTVRDELRVAGSGRAARLVRVYEARDEILGPRSDTIVNWYPSLVPVSQRSRSSHGAEFLEFRPGEVTGRLRLTNGDAVPLRTSLPETVFGAASFDLVLRSAPLNADWAADVPVFLPASRTVALLRARVVGAERVAGEECWRIDADFAGTAVTFWVGTQSRRLCRQVMQLRPDARILFGAFPAPVSPHRPAA